MPLGTRGQYLPRTRIYFWTGDGGKGRYGCSGGHPACRGPGRPARWSKVAQKPKCLANNCSFQPYPGVGRDGGMPSAIGYWLSAIGYRLPPLKTPVFLSRFNSGLFHFPPHPCPPKSAVKTASNDSPVLVQMMLDKPDINDYTRFHEP